MAKTRMEKNQQIHRDLKLEEQQHKSKNVDYEKKLETIDPSLVKPKEEQEDYFGEVKKEEEIIETSETQNYVSTEVDNNPLVEVVEKPKLEYFYSKEYFDENEEISKQPLTFTDKLSVEELLRVRIEEQERIRAERKSKKRNPNTANYTPEMMYKRISPDVGVDVRKKMKIKRHKNTDFIKTFIVVFLILLAVIATGWLLYLVIF